MGTGDVPGCLAAHSQHTVPVTYDGYGRWPTTEVGCQTTEQVVRRDSGVGVGCWHRLLRTLVRLRYLPDHRWAIPVCCWAITSSLVGVSQTGRANLSGRTQNRDGRAVIWWTSRV
jgi:hypothetical protein